ncbi:hypothetical protein PMIN06_003685 [Paraphaeosphaeria minitans]
MATSSKHDAVRVEDTPEKEHTVDESRLDRNIHLNGAIQAKIDKDENNPGLAVHGALIDPGNLPNIPIAGMGKELETTKGNR